MISYLEAFFFASVSEHGVILGANHRNSQKRESKRASGTSFYVADKIMSNSNSARLRTNEWAISLVSSSILQFKICAILEALSSVCRMIIFPL